MTSYLPNSVTAPITQGTDYLKSTIGGLTWGPALSVSKAAVTSLFERIERGTLLVTDVETGKTIYYGAKIAKEHKTNGVNGVNEHCSSRKAGAARKIELRVINQAFWVRLFLFADMGFAEAYMLGEVECDDLTGFFEVCCASSTGDFVLPRTNLILISPVAFYPKPQPTLKRHNPYLLHRRHHYRTRPKYKYPFQFPPQRLRSLRYLQRNVRRVPLRRHDILMSNLEVYI